ncbi:MAG: hypothetical protein LC664_04410, partial [Flavobacteriales bacterium]|nr:hypothetical protein [Flavobacteriales bacterium]
MKKNTHKPSPQAKALSLFLMAYKEKNPFYKEELKRINKQWDLLRNRKINSDAYLKEVETMLAKYGGYDEVVEKTVRFYIDKTGEWKLNGDDPY